MTFRLANIPTADGDARAALIDGDRWFDLATTSGDQAMRDPLVAIARHGSLHEVAASLAGAEPSGLTAAAELAAPIPRPSKVFGIGLNYRAHAAETGAPLPESPLTFTKFPSCIAGPVGEIELRGDTVDWEVELVVVIGSRCRDVKIADGWSKVAGLTLGQDISDRTVQYAGQPPQFSLGKSFDGYGPIGPVICSVDTFDDPDDIGVTCSIDGEEMQNGRTDDLVFGVPALVEYLSSICTLEPGDLIFTGTPAGVGVARGRFLAPGNTIVSTAEHIGTMTHRMVGHHRAASTTTNS